MPEDNLTPPEPPFPIAVEEQKPSSPAAPPPPANRPEPTTEVGAQAKKSGLKRFLPILAGLGIIILLFLLVTKIILPKIQKQKTPEIITLKYWGLWEPENLMAEVISDYQQVHPNITVQYLRQSPKDYRERLQSSLAKGDGPDIFRWHNTWLPMLKTDLASIPDTVYSPNEFDTTFYPIVKKDAFFNGNYYGLPLMFDTLVLYINEDIFQSGSTLKIPTTWDNLRQAAYKLTVRDERGNPTRAGIALGTAVNVDNFSDIIGLMILQNGGNPGKPDTEAVISAIKFYTLFATQDRSWSDQLPNSTYAFAAAKTAMMIAPSWRALEVKAISPQLNFKLYPVPQLPGTNISWATYWLEGVSKKSVNSAAAWEFVKYLNSREVLTKMYNFAAKTRLFGEPYPRQDMASLLQTDPFLGAVLSQALSAQSWPLSSRTFDNGLNDKLIKYYEDAINSYLNNQPEKEITQKLTQGVTQVLSQYGLAN